MNQTAKHVIFTGQVQGVGFRFTAFDVANRYNLTGIVRNLPDSSVEMVIQGNGDDIVNCIADIKRSFDSYIRKTVVADVTFNPQYTDFKITF